jgi:hypothetical protein
MKPPRFSVISNYTEGSRLGNNQIIATSIKAVVKMTVESKCFWSNLQISDKQREITIIKPFQAEYMNVYSAKYFGVHAEFNLFLVTK